MRDPLVAPQLSPFNIPNAKPYPWLFRHMLHWLQRRCMHRTLKADVLEGQCHDYAVRWCETCGGVWLVCDGTPTGLIRMPEPTWDAEQISE